MMWAGDTMAQWSFVRRCDATLRTNSTKGIVSGDGLGMFGHVVKTHVAQRYVVAADSSIVCCAIPKKSSIYQPVCAIFQLCSLPLQDQQWEGPPMKFVRPVLGARACLTRSHKCADSGSFAEL